MNEQIKQIAERLRGLRDVLELTVRGYRPRQRHLCRRIPTCRNWRLRHLCQHVTKNSPYV